MVPCNDFGPCVLHLSLSPIPLAKNIITNPKYVSTSGFSYALLFSGVCSTLNDKEEKKKELHVVEFICFDA